MAPLVAIATAVDAAAAIIKFTGDRFSRGGNICDTLTCGRYTAEAAATRSICQKIWKFIYPTCI